MNALNRGWRYAAVAACVLGLPLAAACGAAGADGSDSNESDATGDEELSIEFPTMYSAYGGDHEYQLPAHIGGIKNVKWSAEPADAVSFAKQDDDSGSTTMITVKKQVDEIKIIAKAGGLKSTAVLHVTASTDDLWTQGSERYNNGVTFKKPDRGDGGAGGGGRPDGGWGKGERVVDKKLACTNCHAKGGKGSDVEHTPTQTAGYSDEDLINIFTKATKPSWAKMRVMKADQWKKIHTWEMDEDEKTGLIVYLRSLTPESQGELDFGGGVFGHGGKGGGKGKGKGKGSDDSDKPATDDKPADDNATTK